MKIGLIVLDTLRYDVFRDHMEGLQNQADHIFTNMYSTSRWTPPVHASLFTGLYPSEVGTDTRNPYLTTPEATLAERFKATGFTTAMISNNGYIDPFHSFDRGFDIVHRGPNNRDRPSSSVEFDWDSTLRQVDNGIKKYPQALKSVLTSDSPTVPALSAGAKMILKSVRTKKSESETLEWAIDGMNRVMESDTDDLFVFLNLMSCHFPYNPPEEYLSADTVEKKPIELMQSEDHISDSIRNRIQSTYRSSARYLDDRLPDIIEGVDWDLLFVVSDHGELLGEGEMYGHEYGMDERLVHVPAVALGSAVSSRETDAITSLLDVHRSLASVGGLPQKQNSRGKNIITSTLDRNRSVYAESSGIIWTENTEYELPSVWNNPHYMLRSTEGKMIIDKDGTRTFDPISGESIPKNQFNFEEKMKEIKNQLLDRTGTEASKDIPTEVNERLEQLGYK